MAKPQAHKRNDGAPEVSKFPEGWILSRLAQLATDVQPGFACGRHTDSVSGVPHLRPMNVTRAGKIDLRTLIYVPKKEVSRDERWLRQGDVVFNNTNSPELVGKTACYNLPEPRAFSNHMTRIRCDARAVDSRFCGMALHEKWLRGHFESICNNHVSQASVGRKALFETLILLPPLAEQKRIVAKVEALLARVDAARERLTQVPATLKRFRKSVIAAACSGRLTAGWRDVHHRVEPAEELLKRIRHSHYNAGLGFGGKAADPTEEVHDLAPEDLPSTWDLSKLMELCEPGRPIVYGILKPGPDLTTGVPYVRVADFPNDRINQSSVRKTSAAIAKQYSRATLSAGDVLLSIRGTVGRVCPVPKELAGANITQDTARISVHHEVDAEYIAIYLRCPSVSKRFERALRGVAVRGINIGDVRALQIALPPIEEQREIVQRVEALFKLADAIEKRVALATARAEKLTQSILLKAFRGELVPTEAELARREGRVYESASVLLDKIIGEGRDLDQEQRSSQRRFVRTSANSDRTVRA